LVARASMTCLPAASWAPSAPSTRLRWPVHFARPVGVDDVARRPPPLHPPIIYAVRRLLVTRQAPGPRSVSDPVRRRRVGATVTVTATVRAGVAHGYRLPPLGCLRRATPDRMLRGDVAQEGAIGLGAITAALYSRSSPRPVPRLRWRLRRVCRLPPGRLPLHRRGCTDPFTSRNPGRRELIARRLQGSPRIIHADATPRSLHASGGTYDVLAGCLRDVFRSIVAAAPTHSRRASPAVATCSPAASGRALESSTPTRRPVHLTRPLAVDVCPPSASGTISAPSTWLHHFLHVACPLPTRIDHRAPPGHPPDHPRGCDDPFPSRFRCR